MTDNELNRRKRIALTKILEITSTSSGKLVATASAVLGILALFPDIQLPPEVAAIAGGIGVEALGAIIERVAYKDDLSSEEIRSQIEEAISQSGLDELLTKDDFYHAFSHLLKRQKKQSEQNEDILRTIQRVEDLLSSRTEQAFNIESSTPIDIAGYLNWIQQKAQLVASTVPLMVEEEITVLDILRYSVEVDSELNIGKPDTHLSVIDVCTQLSQTVIVGESGSGKTVALWQLVLHQCTRIMGESGDEKLPVYINLAGYNGEPIVDLIQQSFRAASILLSHQAIENHSVNQYLRQKWRRKSDCVRYDFSTTTKRNRPTQIAHDRYFSTFTMFES